MENSDRVLAFLVEILERKKNVYEIMISNLSSPKREYYQGRLDSLIDLEYYIVNDFVSDDLNEGGSDDNINVTEVLDATRDSVDTNDLDFLFDIRGKHDLL